MYSANIKKETAGLSRPRVLENSVPLTVSNISISNLLDYVNKYFPYVLSEDVLKHYGHTERPSGEIGKGILFSDRENVDVYELLGEKKALEKENALLKEEYDYLKQRLKLERQETHGA